MSTTSIQIKQSKRENIFKRQDLSTVQTLYLCFASTEDSSIHLPSDTSVIQHVDREQEGSQKDPKEVSPHQESRLSYLISLLVVTGVVQNRWLRSRIRELDFVPWSYEQWLRISQWRLSEFWLRRTLCHNPWSRTRHEPGSVTGGSFMLKWSSEHGSCVEDQVNGG